MSKAFIRPIILLIVFFLGLYILKGPIRSAPENLGFFKQKYVDPIVLFVKDIWSSTATSSIPSLFRSPYSAVPGSASSTANVGGSTKGETTDPGTAIKPISIPQVSVKNKEILVPKDGTITADASRLSINGIVAQTNKERSAKQFPTLRLNAALNRSAEQKLQDMFTNQYFQHVSPTGVNVSDLVRKSGYEYIVVGENLALGNFGGDVQVVTAWMNSPGHRANILDPRFQEIGIAVGKGIYNGREQWIAVQHFGKPLSSCTSPNAILKDKISQHTSDLAVLETELNVLKKEIEAADHNSPSHHAKVEAYNNKVVDYNTRLEGLKDEIATYNEEVKKFNTCAGLK